MPLISFLAGKGSGFADDSFLVESPAALAEGGKRPFFVALAKK